MNERELFTAYGVDIAVLDFFGDAFQTVSNSSLFFRHSEVQGGSFPVLRFHLGLDTACWSYGQSNPALVSRLIICPSPLEAISWLSFHHKSCSDMDQLLFIATGDIPGQQCYDLVIQTYKRKNIALVMGADLLGRICDIRIVTRIMGIECRFRLTDNGQVLILYKGKQFLFEQDTISLNAFEKACGLRSGIRTYKPKKHASFFSLLSGLSS
ncbi:MAG: hypothetical protein EOO90_06260 [Pedobacter sp.]|nr:MAG: hypothetical protein EOO90_06260 [Pedobacter sp.]